MHHCMLWKERIICPKIRAEQYLWCVAAIKRWSDSSCFLTVFCRTKAHIWLQHQVCSHASFHIFAWLHFYNGHNRLLRHSKLFLLLIQLAAPSYDNTPEMPSRFTPQHSRLSHRAPLKCVVVCFSFFIKFERLSSKLFFHFLSLFELLYLTIVMSPVTDVRRQIALALFLFVCGIVMLTIGACSLQADFDPFCCIMWHSAGACILTGVIDADEYWPSEGLKDGHFCHICCLIFQFFFM